MFFFCSFRTEEKIHSLPTHWWHLPGPAPSWTPACTKMFLESSQALVRLEKWNWKLNKNDLCIFYINIKISFCLTASPHTSSTPNISSVRHADSRGSLISTDSGNSLHEKHMDKGNSLDKVHLRKFLEACVQPFQNNVFWKSNFCFLWRAFISFYFITPFPAMT